MGEIAKLRQVPKLDVYMPLEDDELDQSPRTFILFLEWPQPKEYAWARLTNTNPAVNSDELESVTIFYHAGYLFSFGAKRAGGGLRLDMEKLLTLSALSAIQSVGDL